MTRAHPRAPRRAGFTLVEMLVVILVIGIIAAVATPKLIMSVRESEEAALMTNLQAIQTKIDQLNAPATIDASWFVQGQLPTHPQNSFGVPTIHVLNAPGTPHPVSKVLKAGIAGAYWYNPAEKVIRARVTDQGTSTATLDMYNRVNSSDEAALGNYGGGGGGGS